MDETKMTLANDWDFDRIAGWFCSEKLDGCRAYWDGAKFWTRGGNVIHAPEWFTAGLPDRPLDGEIWAGRGQFEMARLAVQYGRFTPQCRFMIYDCPAEKGSWDRRMLVAPSGPCFQPVNFWQVAGEWDARKCFLEIEAQGGEGIMLRNPNTLVYETKRTRNLLRIKRDAWR
jgi:DNA ligase-1